VRQAETLPHRVDPRGNKSVVNYGLLVNANRGIESYRVAECVLTIAAGSDSWARRTSINAKKTIDLELDILGERLSFRIGIGKGRAKLADIVPLARILCDRITEIVLRRISSAEGSIPCSKGCSACCMRCLVPMSVPEALRFKEEIIAEPANRRESVWEACLRAAQLILRQRPPDSSVYQTDASNPEQSADMSLISSWYTSLNLTCPFLINNVCGIYEQRPLACREHFIRGSSAACRGQGEVAEVLEMPVRLPNVLGQLAGELEGTDVEAVILPLALLWSRENPERAERSWPAELMVKRFVEIVESMARRNMPAVTSRRRAIIGFSKKRRAASQLCRLSSG
jgi:Fe-S-cluster containining protein